MRTFNLLQDENFFLVENFLIDEMLVTKNFETGPIPLNHKIAPIMTTTATRLAPREKRTKKVFPVFIMLPLKRNDEQAFTLNMIHQMDKHADGRTISVSKGDIIEVRLDEVPTTGYMWNSDVINNDLFIIHNNQYSAYSDVGIGGRGVRVLSFKAIKSGAGVISLKNWQRLSGDIYQNFRLTVNVYD